SGDMFIPPPAVGSAMHGDRVLVEIGTIRPDGRAEGRIVRPVNRAHPTVVGIFHYGHRNYVTPIDQKIAQEIVIPQGMEYPDLRTENRELRTGSKQGSDSRHSRKKRSPHRVLGEEAAQRTDWDDLENVVVDVAVTVHRLDNGNFELQVHIADVAHYVMPASALDQEARLRGTSVYFPDRAVPMLPLELSTDICSLRPRVDRLVMSCIMEIDHQGVIVRYELYPGGIRSAMRMTYCAVNGALAGD